jgi:hypothetical protein
VEKLIFWKNLGKKEIKAEDMAKNGVKSMNTPKPITLLFVGFAGNISAAHGRIPIC